VTNQTRQCVAIVRPSIERGAGGRISLDPSRKPTRCEQESTQWPLCSDHWRGMPEEIRDAEGLAESMVQRVRSVADLPTWYWNTDWDAFRREDYGVSRSIPIPGTDKVDKRESNLVFANDGLRVEDERSRPVTWAYADIESASYSLSKKPSWILGTALAVFICLQCQGQFSGARQVHRP